jgi:hypothetical protein
VEASPGTAKFFVEILEDVGIFLLQEIFGHKRR